jgi:hypothetical protein
MRRTIAVLTVCAAVAAVVAAVARPDANRGARPSLRIARAEPLAIAGRNFRPHERVRLTATVASSKRTRSVTAGPQGRFQVQFEQLGASRCDLLRVVAVRRSGKLVIVKRLPAPACLTS